VRRDPVVGADRTPGPGELASAEIERRIAADPAAFATFASGLERAAQGALAAIDARNAQGLMDAGGTIDEACEACHVTYWYPDQQRARP
jgi:cytochrome c556